MPLISTIMCIVKDIQSISRYAEATTAVDTRKTSLTPQYGAPEQWREQRATPATDVYAFGVMTYELLTGSWPFEGPQLAEFRDQHLHREPPQLSNVVDTSLRSVVDECLTKAAQARPTPERLLSRLRAQSEAEAPAGGAAAFRNVHSVEYAVFQPRVRGASSILPRRCSGMRCYGMCFTDVSKYACGGRPSCFSYGPGR